MARGSLPSALVEIDAVSAQLGDRFAVFSDFDGTLAPIVDRPENAQLPSRTRELLADLAERVPVAIVSGRDVEDVAERVGLEAITYVGDHGFTVRGPLDVDGLPRPEGLEEQLAGARRAIEAGLGSLDGVHVEAKRFSLAVHHRQAAPDLEPRVQASVDDAIEGRSLLETHEGRQVVEVVPTVDWDKGKAVQALCKSLGSDRPFTPLYLGDDTTDETAFEALPEDGVGVLVAAEPRPTHADHRVRDPDEVARFLDEINRRAPASDAET